MTERAVLDRGQLAAYLSAVFRRGVEVNVTMRRTLLDLARAMADAGAFDVSRVLALLGQRERVVRSGGPSTAPAGPAR
jgi:hypothetical protein